MKKHIINGLTSLLLPFGAYANVSPPAGTYQRSYLRSGMPSELPLHSKIVGERQSQPPQAPDKDSNLSITRGQPARELVIIDAAVPDKHVFYAQTQPGVEFVELTATSNGLEQLENVLSRYHGLNALHIVSHAEEGTLLLGNTRVTTKSLRDRVNAFAAINGAVRPGGDLLLYGCELGKGSEGDKFLDIIKGNTHVDVAASDNLTGNADHHGDWELEIHKGDIEARPLAESIAMKDFTGVLAFTGTIDFSNYKAGSGAYNDPSFDAQFYESASKNYTLTVNPSNTGSYQWSGSGYVVNAYAYSTSVTLDFTNGETFTPNSISLYNFSGSSRTFYFTTSSGGSINSGAIANFSWNYNIDISALPDDVTSLTITGSGSFYIGIDDFAVSNLKAPADSDATLTAAGGVTEPVGLATTVDTVGEAVDVFDFTLTDGGGGDGLATTVSQIVVNVSGTSTDAERGQVTWRLNGPDTSNVTGTYNAGSDTITFSGLSISVADSGNETYTVNAYFNDTTNLTEDRTIILNVNGDDDLTVGAGGTQMSGANVDVTNGAGTTIDVTATQLAFTTQPAGSVSGIALTTQPVITARDAFGNTDVDFTETITLTEASAGTLSNNTQAATSGVATFTSLTYTATADQQSFTLTANDQDGVGSNLPTVDANAVTSDVVATRLIFTVQPVPTSLVSGAATSFTTVPVITPRDANALVDTGYSTNIVLSVTDPIDGTLDGTINSLTGTGDSDGNGTTVTLTPSSGAATFTGLAINYTAAGSVDTIALRATSGGLTAANSNSISVSNPPTVTDGNISISGASGTGGAYKIGDTVTATWNNTAGGDNNGGVSAVTVDFSQFGGGGSVAATNSSNTWTATYTIVAGAIDGTNRNVSVTATNPGGMATTPDTTNATVDSIAPTVTDANISISGASGPGGVYVIGDTVTATWNNTAGGDNNSDTISGVTVNFSQFGGGSAVAASNSAGTWTATYTIVSGSIDAANRNVSVTATDNAGNGTTRADTTNATVDNQAPTVTDANISISGASGTGGAFKIGDTVTATWNNTAGGDNNSDTISSVTVDFSQFGGGAAVAATNSSGTWTATYTIVAGAIDGTNRNVSVTATDNADNSTTTADTSNATVDTVAPTVTDANISISGASGTGGVFIIGDTVTATWNNTAGGDNNSDTISSVTVNFSQFGGGAAVAATNSAGTWTATYTIVAGAIDTNNRNVSVTATDNAGNSTATADTTNASVDNTAPTVTDGNISISGASGTGGAFKIGDTVTATWNNTAGGDNNSDAISSVTVDFSAFGGGAAVAASNSAGTWTATYTIVSGAIDGTNRNVSVTATDNVGNSTTTADTTNATVDSTAPTVTDANISISGASGTGGAFKIGDTVTATWNNTAGGDNNSDTISSVTVNFSQFGGGAAVAATNSSGTWTATYTIVTGAIDATNRNVSVTATDNAGNSTTTADTTNATVDNIPPTVTDANVSISGATGTGGIYIAGDTVTATWNNTAGGDNNSDTISSVTVNFTAFGGGAAVAATNSSGTWTATHTIVPGPIDGTNRNVSMTATDDAGNSTTTADTSNATVDTQGPSISSVTLPANGSYGTGQNLNFTVNFDEAVTVTGMPRLELDIGGTTRYATYTSGSGTAALLFRYTVQASDSDSDGIALNATLQLNSGTIRDAIGNNTDTNLGAIGSLASVLVDTQAPSISSVTLPANATYLLGQNIDFTVNYDDNVTVTGTPRLALTIGATTRYASYTSGSGTSALLFRYTVQNGDSDGDGIVLNATVDVNGGTVRDVASNDAGTNLGTIGSLAGVLVDALDTDGDGVSDVQEGIDGTDPNDPNDYKDIVAPVVTAPADLVIDATGLYTTVTLRQLLGLAANATDTQVQQAQDALTTDNIDGADCCNTMPLTVSNGIVRLRPGNTTLTWQATDRKGNNGTDTQTIKVRPLVSVAQDQVGVEGGQVTFRVYLNGQSTFYPFDVPYVIDMSGTVDGADHDLIDGNVTFTAGQTQASVTVNLTDDGMAEGDELLVIRLDDQTTDAQDLAGGYSEITPDIFDINAGARTQHTVTITEGNVAPDVALAIQQNAINTSLVTTGGGNVTVNATVTDPNAGDTHTYDWSGTSSQLMDTDGDPADATLVFDPTGLTPGVYTLDVFVTDNSNASDSRRLSFRVVDQAPVLGTADSDGDGIDDQTEGFGDSDGDGIPDYLDNISEDNVLPESADITDTYLIECDPGIRCRLGRFALLGSDGGAQLTVDDITAQADLPADDAFDNVGGIFDFEARDLPTAGQSVRVVIPQIAAIPADAVYRKFANDQWFTFVEDTNNALHSAPGEAGYCPPPGDASWEPGLVAGYFCVQVTVEDGGANDADGLANSSVEDPGGVGTAAAPPPPPTTTWTIHGKTKSGGGSLDMIAGLTLLLLVLFRNRRRVIGLFALAAVLFAPLLHAQDGMPGDENTTAIESSAGEPVDESEHWWQRFQGNSYLTLGLYQAKGDQQRGDFVSGMAGDGITVNVQEYDVSRSAYQLSLGYRYLPGLAVELGYLDLGDADFTFTATATDAATVNNALSKHLPVSSDGWVIANRFDYQFGDWRASADLGLYIWNGKAAIDDPAINADIKDGTDPLLGLSVAYPLPAQLELALQYRRILFDDQNVELWGAALSWDF